MDLRYILSWVLPMPMATTYRAVDADGHDLGMETCRWWQWAGRAYRIRTSET